MIDRNRYLDGSDKICVVGLGYVGLPLAVILSRQFAVVGFDIKKQRVEELKESEDRTNEVDSEALRASTIEFSTDPNSMKSCRLIIVTVPTPVDEYKIPDLNPVFSASRLVGKHIGPGTTIVYESTVYPGVTEELCVPIIEQESGLKHLVDFHVGYSPERINPGDKQHTVDKIRKVVAGDTPEITDFLGWIYGSVITAGTHSAPNIKTAEAAKVIENTQRDLNIALMNELSIIFNKLGIDTREVLEAAATKWNFLKFEPGLVGGHCIGVDPYYLTFKAESIGYHPEVILAGRRINDSMGKYVAENAVKRLIKAGKAVKDSKVLILGLTFKENINDIRNTRVIDIYHELQEYGVNAFIFDPLACPEEVREEYGIELISDLEEQTPYDAVILAVKHASLVAGMTVEKVKEISTSGSVILIDVKGVFDKDAVRSNGISYWRL